MVSTTLIALVVSLGILADNVLATPSPKVDDVQTAHLKFRASSSPDTYDLTIQADGNVVKTGAPWTRPFICDESGEASRGFMVYLQL